jgi:RIO-like serine/threonine protein kinase
MKQKRGHQKFASLVPTVSTTEQRLDKLMADARQQAERTVADARARALEMIREAGAGLPAILSTEREAAVRRLRQEAEQEARAEHERTETLKRDARGRIDAAVALVVGRVWPGGGT